METIMTNEYNNRIEASYKKLQFIIEIESKGIDKVADYIGKVSGFLLDMIQLEKELSDDYFQKKSFDELLELNHSYYKDIANDQYLNSYANPDKATSVFGLDIGQILASVYSDVRQSVGFAFEHRRISLMWVSELLIDIYEVLVENRDNIQNNKETEAIKKQLISKIQNHAIKDMKDRFIVNLERRFNPEFKHYSKMITSMDLEDDRYIFRYGMYIGYNELELLKYFKTCRKEQLQEMANTYTEAFLRGFKKNNVDLNKKKTVNIGFHIGFEPVIQLAVKNLEKVGLSPLVYYDLKGSPRPRIMNTKPSKQFEYDHRHDDGLYLDEAYSKAILASAGEILDQYKTLIGQMAGPAVMEVFGETPFAPKTKETCIKYDEKTKELSTRHGGLYQQMFNKYLPKSDYSFVIISFPVPEIGPQFKEIFDETIIVNTLDEEKYMTIQQCIIEALDKGDSVHVTGRNGNRTDLTISLNDKVDYNCQTNFNNCTADVNVPVGEVFTSPKLEGTYGKLHVKEVYLHGLKFIDLDIDFKEGMMDDYTCKNFESDEDNKNYILENMTHYHKSLPLGEFAIGTNTTAYVMARKYNIEKIIPILIGEKMGPHFAVGDTCYNWSEDVSVYNPDGREIVARENSKSAKRKTNIDEAYTYCHTDITIPYTELDCITVNLHDGGKLDIIRGGRFVLNGTESLNEPLKELEV